MGWLRTLVVLACCLGVVGCSDDSPGPEPGPSPTGSVSTPTPSSSSSAPEPAPTEPALPGAAKEATERGARAFIAYYWELINYAQVTGDVTALKRVSGPNCDGCNAGIEGIRDLYRDGGHIEGGDYAIRVVKLNALATGAEHSYEAKLTARTSEQQVVEPDGSTTTNPAASSTVVMAVIWADQAWRMEAMQIR